MLKEDSKDSLRTGFPSKKRQGIDSERRESVRISRETTDALNSPKTHLVSEESMYVNQGKPLISKKKRFAVMNIYKNSDSYGSSIQRESYNAERERRKSEIKSEKSLEKNTQNRLDKTLTVDEGTLIMYLGSTEIPLRKIVANKNSLEFFVKKAGYDRATHERDLHFDFPTNDHEISENFAMERFSRPIE